MVPVVVVSVPAVLVAIAVVAADGSWTYDPTGSAVLNPMWVGDQLVDTFTYNMTDSNGGNDSATVFVTVDGANDAPIADPESYAVANSLPHPVADERSD